MRRDAMRTRVFVTFRRHNQSNRIPTSDSQKHKRPVTTASILTCSKIVPEGWRDRLVIVETGAIRLAVIRGVPDADRKLLGCAGLVQPQPQQRYGRQLRIDGIDLDR